MDVNDVRDVHITSRSFWEQKMRLRCVMTHEVDVNADDVEYSIAENL